MRLVILLVVSLNLLVADEAKNMPKISNSVTGEEFKKDPSDSLSKLTLEESQIVSDNMLELQNLQLRFQAVQIQLQELDKQIEVSRITFKNYEQELSKKYNKIGCTLSLKRDWICSTKDGSRN